MIFWVLTPISAEVFAVNMQKQSSPKMNALDDVSACLNSSALLAMISDTGEETNSETLRAIVARFGFLNYDSGELRDALKRAKYRFYNLRSKYIVEARWIVDELPGLIANGNRHQVRDYLVDNVMGIGYKEASHFLRNVGIFDFAILDKHILRMLASEYPGIRIRVGSRQSYLDTEKYVIDIARGMGMEAGILDLYMWKLATGKIIK